MNNICNAWKLTTIGQVMAIPNYYLNVGFDYFSEKIWWPVAALKLQWLISENHVYLKINIELKYSLFIVRNEYLFVHKKNNKCDYYTWHSLNIFQLIIFWVPFKEGEKRSSIIFTSSMLISKVNEVHCTGYNGRVTSTHRAG